MFYSETWMQLTVIQFLIAHIMLQEDSCSSIDVSLDWEELESESLTGINSNDDFRSPDASSLITYSDNENISQTLAQFVTSPDTQAVSSAISCTECDNPFNIVVRCCPQSSSSASTSGQLELSLDSPLKQIYSDAIKEELRCRIQLKRVNMGEDELQVEYKESVPTISYEAVQKRNEIREKNKMYAKQSRERAKEFRKSLVDENKKLSETRLKLNEEICALKQRYRRIKDIFRNHRKVCQLSDDPVQLVK